MAYARACAVTEVPEGAMKRVRVNGHSVLVYHLEDGFFATQSACTHTFGPLQRGKIVDGCRIRCPLHRAEFDIKTGEATQWANFPPGVQLLNVFRGKKPLATYPTRVDGGDVMVDV